MSNSKDGKPFALADTLRDLAFLRVSGLDASSLLPSTSASANDMPDGSVNDSVNDSVNMSHRFVQEARTVLTIHNQADVAMQGRRVEEVRIKLDELLAGV